MTPPELPDDDWPDVPISRVLAVIALMIVLVIAVVIA